jgi:hypothetical protein
VACLLDLPTSAFATLGAVLCNSLTSRRPAIFGLERRVDSVLDTVTTLSQQVTQLSSLPTNCTIDQRSSITVSGDILVHIGAAQSQSVSPMTVKKPTSLADSNGRNTNLAKISIPADSLGKYCKPWCSCKCHNATTLETPKSVQCAFGSLTLTHKGLLGLMAACDQTQCRRKIAPRMTVTYRFARSWLQRKFVSCTISTLAGPELSVKLPRMVDWTSPVWQHATAGNVSAVKALWQNGLASPWDVSPCGGNLLHVCETR